MPSGSKKRKAARKKKEKEEAFNNSNTNNSTSTESSSNSNRQGNDDHRNQDERDSDGGEVSSPLSQDYQHQFNKGNEESEKISSLSVRSFVPGKKPLERVTRDVEGSQKIGIEDDDVVKIERELNLKQDAESHDVTVEHVDSPKESHDGDDSNPSSSSSSSSSDNESQGSEKKCKEETCNSVLSAASCNNEEKTVSEEATLTPENEKPVKEVNINSVVETEPVVPVSDTVKHVVVGAQVENSEVVDVVESGLTENEDKSLPISDDVIGDSVVVPVKNDDKIFPILDDEKVGAPSEVVVSTVNGNDGKTLAALGTHTAETSRDAGNTKDSATSEFTEDQTLIASAPRVTQRTFWTSCCGLFEVFTGSNR